MAEHEFPDEATKVLFSEWIGAKIAKAIASGDGVVIIGTIDSLKREFVAYLESRKAG